MNTAIAEYFNETALTGGFLASGEAESHRLVEDCKSPTKKQRPEWSRWNDPLVLADAKKQFERWSVKPCDSNDTLTRIQRRDWSNEWRIKPLIGKPAHGLPPEQEGDRYTDMLTERGARKIADSCLYMAAEHDGYSTFVTGTFKPESREKINRKVCEPVTDGINTAFGPYSRVMFEDGVFSPVRWCWDSSVQREVTRTLDAMQKMYQRGWTTESGEWVPPVKVLAILPCGEVKYPGPRVRIGGKKIEGPVTPIKWKAEPLKYCWVVEVPKNEEGDDNPHCHLLMNWQVERGHFKSWAARIEAIWDNGYFHMEKIKDPKLAGAYMAKAAGYMTKAAGDDDQGIVRGNRYGISAGSRAPEWFTVAECEYGVMGRIIYEEFEQYQYDNSELIAERQELHDKKDAVIASAKAHQKKHGKYPLAAKNMREKIAARLAGIRQVFEAHDERPSKYQMVIKGGVEKLGAFLQRARSLGWDSQKGPAKTWVQMVHAKIDRWKQKRHFLKRGNAWSDHDLAQWSGIQSDRDQSVLKAWYSFCDELKGMTVNYQSRFELVA